MKTLCFIYVYNLLSDLLLKLGYQGSTIPGEALLHGLNHEVSALNNRFTF